ncbi:MAG: lysophospholipid acyltransferase family protein [Candidatus Coatesbacteria bacterium]|nr:lysophospholipid acyltransferase family protein [Candidatus Coatesbacteria bacterium]
MRFSKRLKRRYKSVSRAIKYWIGLQLLKALLHILPLFPLSLLERFGRIIGSVARILMRESRELAQSNLRLAFPELTEEEMCRIGKRTAQLLLVNAFQVVWMAGHREKIWELIEVEGLDHLETALSSGKGAILLGAHFGNFMLQCLRLGFERFAFSTIVNMPKAERLNSLISERALEMGLNIISRDPPWGATREVIRRLGENEVVCVIADEEARKGGVFVEFFGYEVPTPKGPAMFALRSGAPILPVFIYRLGGMRQRIVIEPPLNPPDYADDEAFIESNTAAMAAIIENTIRRHPEEWSWITHRWRKRRNK